MSTNFPGTKQTLPNPSSTDNLENATAELDHDYQHTTINDTVEALQDKVGVDGDATNTTHDYKLSGVATGDKAVSLTGTETLTNKTLTSPTVNLTSDATGDTYYRSSGGALTRLPIGTEDQILSVSSSGIPEWISDPDSTDASTTTTGVVEIATQAEYDAGTDTGSDGPLVVPPSMIKSGTSANELVRLNGSAQLPAVDGSLLTDIDTPVTQTTDPTRSMGTNYQNTTGKTLIVYAIIECGRGGSPASGDYGRATAFMDTNSTPTTEIARCESKQGATPSNNNDYQKQTFTLTFFVPNNSYYAVNESVVGAGFASLVEWKEQELG